MSVHDERCDRAARWTLTAPPLPAVAVCESCVGSALDGLLLINGGDPVVVLVGDAS